MSSYLLDTTLARFGHKVLRHLVPRWLRPAQYIRALAESRTHLIVQRGPFRSMRYVDQSVGSTLVPKWLGTYERELWDCIEEAIVLPFDTVINVGTAEGYYAVGLAIRMPKARIIAFEMDPPARHLLSAMMALNGIENQVTIGNVCSREDLVATLRNSEMTLVVCDAEGSEAILLDPIRVPRLQHCHILVELHDFLIPGLSEEIRDRFRRTHSVRHILQEARHRSEFPYGTAYTKFVPSSIDLALSEGRPCKMAWYWMCPSKHVAQ